MSVDNLLTYQWFVVPRYFYIYSTIPVKPLSYFSGSTYDIIELENFINAFVFTKKITIANSFTRTQLPISKSLVDDFNLSCLFESKISQRACDYYLGDFLDSFFVYAVSIDYPGFKKIFDVIKNVPTYKARLCEWLSKYSLYANDQSDIIKWLFVACGKTYEDIFKRTTLFIEIQKTLENQSFDKNNYKDSILNAYKLLSYQQQIYQDFLINKSDTYKLTAYLDFVDEILKKNTIDVFYKDEIYRFNNNYLSLALEKIAYQPNTFSQNLWSSKLASLLTTINTLNVWDSMIGFSWLIAEIQNTWLIIQKTLATWTINTITQTEKIQKNLKNISYMTIEKQSISETNIDIIAYIKFSSPTKNETIRSHIIMEYVNDMLLVKDIELDNKAEMNSVIKNLLLIQNFSIGELYSYISKNLIFYEQINTPIITNTDICSWLSENKNISIISCTTTTATIEQKTIRYDFTFKDGSLENVTISNKALENSIKASYSTIVWNSRSLINTIQTILNYTMPPQAHEGTTNAVVVFEKIQQYLDIKTNDIADSGGIILVDISLGWINFISNFTLKTNTLGPWYFKDIRVNTKPYLIQNLNLTLDDAHQNDINTFVIDPLTVIKNTDFTARQNYQAFIGKK